MSTYEDVHEFVERHRACGTLAGKATPPTQHGYRLTVTCPCGVVFERWVLPEDAADDLLRSVLLVVDN